MTPAAEASGAATGAAGGTAPGARVRGVRCLGRGGHHRMVYDAYGPAEAPHAVVCVHGLTRNGRDFARLARALAGEGWRVLCPDIVGRGRSDPLAEPADYAVPQYMADLTVMLAAEGVETADWLGTSMGGLIGMALAATPGHPIRRLALNDIGPHVPAAALRRIAEYVGAEWTFDDFEAGLAHIRTVYAPFGLTAEADWRELAEISLRRMPDGRYTNNYDRRIADAFRETADTDLDVWGVWDAVDLDEAPLLLRGAESDMLSAADAEAMAGRGPGARPVEIAGCGHAPPLMAPDQIAVVRDWLAERPAPGVPA